MGRRTQHRPVLRWSAQDGAVRRPDTLAAEEPLEIRLDGSSFTVTMRTPGDDVDLVLGFLLSEGLIRSADDVRTAAYCAGAVDGDANTYNVLDVVLDPAATARRPVRNVLTTSACGLCGRQSIDEVRSAAPYDLGESTARWDPAQLVRLPTILRDTQRVFARTGGLHAAALFAADRDEPLVVREDVGRHNAVDKVVGHGVREGWLPLRDRLLLVSGRASFELVQKAIVAGIPCLAAVSAPSSLAVELAADSGLTLVGFLRGEAMNVYAGAERLGL
ncbi:MAG TPA: formate dehydrogenase accessory sulfurtransferase FdhD [Mycobacteriales bacterium]